MSQPAPINPLSYRQRFPWLNLFRAFQIAIGPRKLLLGFLGVVLLLLGEWLIGRLPFASGHPSASGDPFAVVRLPSPRDPLIPIEQFARDPVEITLRTAMQGTILARPLSTVVAPLSRLFRPDLTWSDVAYLWTWLLWVLVVWALIGGALTRMVAIQFAHGQSLGIAAALKFSATKTLSYIAAVLMPFLVIGVFWICGLLISLLGRIPAVGPVLFGVLWGLVLIVAFCMALVLLVLAVAWPLMIAAISTEESDAFDGLSRAYSFVFDRPWHYLWYVAVSTVYGAVVLLFVGLVAGLAVDLAGWCTESARLGQPTLEPSMSSSVRAAFSIINVWLWAWNTLVAGFTYSYFWTALTIIYFLLRHADDGTALDQVRIAAEQPPHVPLPVVGIAGNEQERMAAPGPTPSLPPQEQP